MAFRRYDRKSSPLVSIEELPRASVTKLLTAYVKGGVPDMMEQSGVRRKLCRAVKRNFDALKTTVETSILKNPEISREALIASLEIPVPLKANSLGRFLDLMQEVGVEGGRWLDFKTAIAAEHGKVVVVEEPPAEITPIEKRS